jgi:hypothetical protein
MIASALLRWNTADKKHFLIAFNYLCEVVIGASSQGELTILTVLGSRLAK